MYNSIKNALSRKILEFLKTFKNATEFITIDFSLTYKVSKSCNSQELSTRQKSP